MTEKSTRELVDRYVGHWDDPRSTQFRLLVDMMVAQIAPDEIRDAAFVASIKFLQMHPTDLIYRRDDLPGLNT